MDVNHTLDLIDRKIVYELDLNSSISFKALGKKLHIAKETIGYRIKQLIKNGYIKHFLTTINISHLGFFYYKLFYKFHKTTPAIDKEIVKFIQEYGSIAYFASLQGRYDVNFLILSKNMNDLSDFLILFREKFGSYILEQEILTVTSVQRFNLRFFYDAGDFLSTKYSGRLHEAPVLDRLDYFILHERAKNSRVQLLELAHKGNTTVPTIKSHLKKLSSLGILGNAVIAIDFEKFGMQFIQIYFSLKNHSVIEKLINYVAPFKQILFADVMLGKYDLALELVAKNPRELTEIINAIKERFSDDITTYDIFILEEHEINWFPAIKKI